MPGSRSDDRFRDSPDHLRRSWHACPLEDDVTAFVHGELPHDATERFREHFATCSSCRDAVAATRELLGDLRRASRPTERPSSLAARVVAAARAREAGTRRATRLPARLATATSVYVAAAAAAVLVAAGVTWYAKGSAPDRSHPRFDVARVDVAAAATVERNVAPATPPAESPTPVGAAVAESIDWLLRSQDPTGGWSAASRGGDPQYDVALTGLATLAILDAGDRSTDRDATEPTADAAHRAVGFLATQQVEDGRFGPVCPGAVYNHSIASLAMLEWHATHPDRRYTATIRRAVDWIVRAQAREGGWGYQGDSAAATSAMTCWPLQTLVVARETGFDALDEPIASAYRYLAGVVDARGRVGYRRPGEFVHGSETLTAMGAYCALLARDASIVPPELRGRLADEVLRESRTGGAPIDLYCAFFRCSVLDALPGRTGDREIAAARAALASIQVREGSDRGSWEPADAWGTVGGRVYATALASLILQAEGAPTRVVERLAAATISG